MKLRMHNSFLIKKEGLLTINEDGFFINVYPLGDTLQIEFGRFFKSTPHLGQSFGKYIFHSDTGFNKTED